MGVDTIIVIGYGILLKRENFKKLVEKLKNMKIDFYDEICCAETDCPETILDEMVLNCGEVIQLSRTSIISFIQSLDYFIDSQNVNNKVFITYSKSCQTLFYKETGNELGFGAKLGSTEFVYPSKKEIKALEAFFGKKSNKYIYVYND